MGTCSTSWHTSGVSCLVNRRLPGGDLLIKIPDGDPYRTITKLDRQAEQAEVLQEAIANYRRLKKLLRGWEAETERLIDATTPSPRTTAQETPP